MAKPTPRQANVPKKERIFYYESTEDDPIKLKEQEEGKKVQLPESYKYISWNPLYKALELVLVCGFKVYGYCYEYGYWKLKVVGREKLKKASRRQGYMLYCNHTNPYHDVFGPDVAANRRIFTVISPTNLKIPKIGWTLPYIGGLPLGTSDGTKRKFHAAVDKRLKQRHCVVVYPEAHVWPFYTGIRPFPAGDRSFVYAVRNNVPVFTLTTTYHRNPNGKTDRPTITEYLDGPFYPDPKKSDAENQAALARQAYESMLKYSKKSTYDYFTYLPKSKQPNSSPPSSASRKEAPQERK